MNRFQFNSKTPVELESDAVIDDTVNVNIKYDPKAKSLIVVCENVEQEGACNLLMEALGILEK